MADKLTSMLTELAGAAARSTVPRPAAGIRRRGERLRARRRLAWAVLSLAAVVAAGCGVLWPRPAGRSAPAAPSPTVTTEVPAATPTPSGGPGRSRPAGPPGSPTASAAPDARVYLGRCYYPGERLLIRPAFYVFGCDSTGYLSGMTWTGWTEQGADGTGTVTITDCVPNCATSRRYSVPAVVHLAEPRAVPAVAACSGGARFWAKLIIGFPGAVPPFLKPSDLDTTLHGKPAITYPDLPSVSC